MNSYFISLINVARTRHQFCFFLVIFFFIEVFNNNSRLAESKGQSSYYVLPSVQINNSNPGAAAGQSVLNQTVPRSQSMIVRHASSAH